MVGFLCAVIGIVIIAMFWRLFAWVAGVALALVVCIGLVMHMQAVEHDAAVAKAAWATR